LHYLGHTTNYPILISDRKRRVPFHLITILNIYTLRMLPNTTTVTFIRRIDNKTAEAVPAMADSIFPVEYNIPGNMRAPKAAKGMNWKKDFKNGGSFISLRSTIGSIRGIYVTAAIDTIMTHRYFIINLPPQEI
jgi:hypothetical protein